MGFGNKQKKYSHLPTPHKKNKIWFSIILPTYLDTGCYETFISMIFGGINEYYGFEFLDFELNTQLASFFIEAIDNAAKHGNGRDKNKTIDFGFWLGSKGILFAIRDQGDFYQKEETKKLVESRIDIPGTKKDSGGWGMDIFYQADELFVSNEENTLYLLLLKKSFFRKKVKGGK